MFHRPSVVGMARSIGWLSMFVGLDFVYGRGMATARRAADRLAAIPGVTVLTPRDRMATLVTFRIAGWPAADALEELGRRTFAIARTIASLDAVRISVGFFTSDEELERFCEGVELLAVAHARDDPAAPDAGHAAVSRDRRPTPVRRRSRGRDPLAPVPQRARDRSCARCGQPSVAVVLAVAYLVYDIALSRGVDLPGGDLRLLALALYVVLVLAIGSARDVPGRPAADRVRVDGPAQRRGARPSGSSPPCRSPIS